MSSFTRFTALIILIVLLLIIFFFRVCTYFIVEQRTGYEVLPDYTNFVHLLFDMGGGVLVGEFIRCDNLSSKVDQS